MLKSIAFLLILCSVTGAQASIVSHFDFGDGNLLDNSVLDGSGLHQSGPSDVMLLNGRAIFTAETGSNSSEDNSLTADLSEALDIFTVSFWFKTSVVNQGGTFQGLFSSRSPANDTSWQLYSNGGTSDGRLFIRSGVDTQITTDVSSSGRHEADVWYHVALVYSNEILNLTVSSEGGSFGDLVDSHAHIDELKLEQIILGSNRALGSTYGMELSNVRVYGDISILPEALFIEGKNADTIPPYPIIQSFTASDQYVIAGSRVTLSWETIDTTSLEISPGIGDVTAQNSIEVDMNESTSFVLNATNSSISTHSELKITVGPERPNILVLLVDDYGPMDTSEPFHYDQYNDLGTPVETAFNTFYKTPNLELLADRGMKFTQAYALPVCGRAKFRL